MTMKKGSLAVAVLFSQFFCISVFSQGTNAAFDVDAPMVFTKPDGTEVSARIDKYSTSSGMVRARTEDGEYVEKKFDQILPHNQAIILEWKMNQIVQSSALDVTYVRKKGGGDTSYLQGTDIKVDKNTYYYELTIENESDLPIKGLKVGYAIAYKRDQRAGLGLQDPKSGLGFHAMALPVMDIAAGEKKVVVTPPITLKNYENVVDNSDDDGDDDGIGGGRSTEQYAGVLFRFIRNGVKLRDVASPPSIASREFDLENIPDSATPAPNVIPQ